jgi:hypothetical protein
MKESHERRLSHGDVVQKLLRVDDQLLPGFALQGCRKQLGVCNLQVQENWMSKSLFFMTIALTK